MKTGKCYHSIIFSTFVPGFQAKNSTIGLSHCPDRQVNSQRLKTPTPQTSHMAGESSEPIYVRKPVYVKKTGKKNTVMKSRIRRAIASQNSRSAERTAPKKNAPKMAKMPIRFVAMADSNTPTKSS